ncbi:MAG: transposase, partial [Candidatus Sigynarchaeota archaeon]
MATQSALPDPDARIGYNVAKDKAYIGYKCHAIVGNTSHAFYGIRITPANTGDAKHFIPLMEQAVARQLLSTLSQVHGDCAYHVEINLDWLDSPLFECKFHDQSESGLNRRNKRSARKKSKIRP